MRWRGFSTAARVWFVLALCNVLVQSLHLVDHVPKAASDFGVFYETGVTLAKPVTDDFYNAENGGLLHCIPPTGTMFFFWMPWTSLQGAAVICSLFNIAMLAAGLWFLRGIYLRLDHSGRLYRRTWLWAAFVYALLASGNIQTGQFGSLFSTCWLGHLYASLAWSGPVAAAFLALPATIKLYPGFLWLVPLSRRKYKEALWLIPAALAWAFVAPSAVYGLNVVRMWRDFCTGVLMTRATLSSTPEGLNNQALETVFLRYLTYVPGVHDLHPLMPHLSLDPDLVLALAWTLRLAIILVTAVTAFRLGRSTRAATSSHLAVVAMALWSAAFYLIVLETKCRYSIYLFPAFLPLLAMAAAQYRNRLRYVGWCVFLTLCVVSVFQLVPEEVRMLGPSLFANLAIWAILVRHCWRLGGRANAVWTISGDEHPLAEHTVSA